MATKWKKVVEEMNSETYVLPDGWDSRDTIADALECSPEKVDDNLRPGLKSGRFIKQQFKVWDTNLKRNIMVIAYHDTETDEVPEIKTDTDLGRMRSLHAQGMTYDQIGEKMGISGEAVRSKLRRSK